MKIVHTETLLNKGEFSTSDDWETIQKEVTEAMAKVVWPVGTDQFTIYVTARRITSRIG